MVQPIVNQVTRCRETWNFRIRVLSLLVLALFLVGANRLCGQEHPLLQKARAELSMTSETEAIKNLIPRLKVEPMASAYLIYELARHPNPVVRGHIARALRFTENNVDTGVARDNAVIALDKALDDDVLYNDPTETIECGEGVLNGAYSVQAEAAQSLGILKAQNKSVIRKLTKIAGNTDPTRIRARHAAIVALGQIGPNAAKSAAAVAKVLKAKTPQHIRLRYAAIQTLGELGPGASSELPCLVKLLEEKQHRTAAIYAIAGMKEGAKSLIPMFIENSHAEGGLHYRAALAKIGKSVHPFVLEEIRSEDPKHRDRALSILSMMDRDATFALDEIRSLLDDPSQQIQEKAIGRLLQLEELAAPAKPELEEVLQSHPAETMQNYAMIGLLMCEANHPQALARLKRLAEDPNQSPIVIWASKYAKGHARSILPILQSKIKENSDLREKVKLTKALLFIDEDSMLGLETLRRAIRSTDRSTRFAAYRACEWLGSGAQALIPDLTAVKEPNDQERILRVLERIEAETPK